MSNPLMPKVVPEIDANPGSFFSGGRRKEGWFGLELVGQFHIGRIRI